MAAELYYSLAEAQAGMGDRQTPFYITGYTTTGARAHLEDLTKPASPCATLCTKCLRFHYNAPRVQCGRCNPPNRPRSNSAPSRRPRPQTEDGPQVVREREAQAAAEDAYRAQEMRQEEVG